MLRSRGGAIYVISVLLHAGGAFAIAHIEREEVREPTRISIQEVRKPKAKAPEVKAPPPPEAKRKAPKKAQAPAAAPQQAPTPAPAEVPAFDLTLSGGIGAGVASGGIAVPVAGVAPGPPKPVAARKAPPKALLPSKAKSDLAECAEALVKPRPISIPQPVYADRAREAGIQGKVRVELTVDATGAVVNARVIEPLGHGLDEAALEAARAARFEPATRCGKPTATAFVIGIRFTL